MWCGAVLPAVSLPLVQGCSRGEGLCAGPETLSRGEEQMRKTREYVETSSFDQRSCAGCAFFHSDKPGQCGHCEILNGPVSAGGYCTSWAV